MKLSALNYYFSSIQTILEGLNFWMIPLILFKSPVLIKVNNGLTFWVLNLMDIWTVKEVVLDKQYLEYYKIKKEDVVIDIGGGFGDLAIMADKAGAEVFSFEPDKNWFRVLNKNCQINSCSRTQLVNKAVTSLDEVFSQYKIKNCDFLKIDCEGNEYQIFKNSKNSLSKIKNIAFEVHFFTPEMRKNYSILKETLTKSGFKLHEQESPVHSYIGFLFCTRSQKV